MLRSLFFVEWGGPYINHNKTATEKLYSIILSISFCNVFYKGFTFRWLIFLVMPICHTEQSWRSEIVVLQQEGDNAACLLYSLVKHTPTASAWHKSCIGMSSVFQQITIYSMRWSVTILVSALCYYTNYISKYNPV